MTKHWLVALLIGATTLTPIMGDAAQAGFGRQILRDAQRGRSDSPPPAPRARPAPAPAPVQRSDAPRGDGPRREGPRAEGRRGGERSGGGFEGRRGGGGYEGRDRAVGVDGPARWEGRRGPGVARETAPDDRYRRERTYGTPGGVPDGDGVAIRRGDRGEGSRYDGRGRGEGYDRSGDYRRGDGERFGRRTIDAARGGGDGRYDGRRSDGRRDGRYDDRRHDDRRYGDRRYDGRHYDGRHAGRWSRDWRRDYRYDWRGHRDRYSHIYQLPTYYSPYRSWRYQRLSVGFSLWPLFYGQRHWISDPWQYRLPEAYGDYRWVRYYDDALLVDLRTGEVVDVIHDVFY